MALLDGIRRDELQRFRLRNGRGYATLSFSFISTLSWLAKRYRQVA